MYEFEPKSSLVTLSTLGTGEWFIYEDTLYKVLQPATSSTSGQLECLSLGSPSKTELRWTYFATDFDVCVKKVEPTDINIFIKLRAA